MLVALVLLAGCASGAEVVAPVDNEPLIEIVTEQIAEDAWFWGDIDQDCFARGAVTGLGGANEIEERFGVTASGTDTTRLLDTYFESKDAEIVATSLSDCGYFEATMAQWASEAGLSEADEQCMVAEVDKDDFAGALAIVFMDPAASAYMADARNSMLAVSLITLQNKCGLSANVVTEWVTFGDDS